VAGYRSRHREGLIAATVRVFARAADGTDDGCGTGFFVAPGLVVTCAHVVPEVPGGSVVVGYGTQEYPAQVLLREPADAGARTYSHPDVALLRVGVEEHPCVPLGGDQPPAPGRELFAYGCPLLRDGAFWDHMTMASEGTRAGLTAGEVWIKTSRSQVQPGASGSGAVDVETGLLVGMLKLSRDPTSDLGGVLVPTPTIVRTLAAAGHDVLPDNRAAVQRYDTVAGVSRRLGSLLDALIGDLDVTRGVGPAELRRMLRVLAEEPPDPVDAKEAALALLHLDLEQLAEALEELARACHSAVQPGRVLVTAASLALLGNQAWVDPRAADLLIAERTAARPRIVQVPASCRRSVELHAIRAATRRSLQAVPLAPPDAETDPATGLPARLLRSVRYQLLHSFTTVSEDDPEGIDRIWQQRRDTALARAGRLLLVLPPEACDAATLADLQAEFRPCLFAVAARDLRPGLRGSPLVLALPGALPEDVEQAADLRYGEIQIQLRTAAG
jgi:hypothetical protein